ncbi:pyridoxal phosphate-dependent aminotransferase [Bacillus sp. AFS076308]|uniref:aminotransferase class I/II-fold pyridoxal phosphate-dependent enzyme n=1 Tax=unclassified Bacillus (in: firmicutes) TaxID=185979 RepID=UPI000BF46ECA|nr:MULTISPECIES: aminotransferase class I/II-fold pyridoxal phosphate-dependent enzyme [unclassified Bacillus (in: firmicutes)]PFO04946.1 pyridoxal phosphate-dependent aminotransferase [Bacillus sp. AFS076308]PGV51043.1 pyridoxal phosphate-dependent aminotransferase [Bacillus sp. AFS037270]
MSSNKKRIFLSSPHMTGHEQKYIDMSFDSNWIAPLGPHVDRFEENISEYVGSRGALAVSSGTAAIHLALRLLDVKAGDRVFCSTLTFIASANPILYQQAEPVFIDSEFDTWNMSPEALKKAFIDAEKDRSLPKAVIVVHLYGQNAKMDEIMDICNFYQVPVIEDAAESLGSTYLGRKSGTLGKFGVFSFNGNKIITTSGGGMLVSNDKEALEKGKFLATQARDNRPYYHHSEVGYNYRMSNILAGIGIAQLAVIEERVKQKQVIFQRYVKELNHIKEFIFMPEYRETRHNRWLTTLYIDSEQPLFTPLELIQELEKENIEARQVWKPMHLQPLLNNYRYYPHSDQLNIAEYLFERGVCLPSGTNMTEEEQTRVIETIQSFISRKNKLNYIVS